MAKQKKLLKRIILWILSILVVLLLILIVNIIIVIKTQSIVTKGKPIADYGKNNPALLVVDIQEVITGKHSLYPGLQKNSAHLIVSINKVIDSFSSRHYPVIYIRSERSNPLINLLDTSYAKGSTGVDYDKRLKIVSGLEVVKTGKDSFRKTRLDSLLTRRQISQLYISGVDAAECVNATVQAAQNRNYQVYIIKEAVISKTQRKTDSMMVHFRKTGVHVISPDSLF